MLTMSGAGFLPNEPVAIYWNWTSPSSPGTPVDTLSSDSTGAFVLAALRVSAAPGKYTVGALGGVSGAYYYVTFTVLPTLAVLPIIGVAGQPVTISGTGYLAGKTFAVYFNSTRQPMSPWSTTQSDGSVAPFISTIPTTATAKAAAYQLIGGAISKTLTSPQGTGWFTVVTPTTPAIAIASSSAAPQGSPGGPLTVAGTNWPTGDTINLYWGTAKAPGTMLVGSAVAAGGSGTFTALATLGSSVAGTWYVWAVDASGLPRASAPYKIVYAPKIGLSNATSVVGGAHAFSVASGGGFAPGEPVPAWLKPPKGVTTTLGTVTAGAAGEIGFANVTATLPATITAGTYTVYAKGMQSQAQASATYAVVALSPALGLSPTAGQPPQADPPTNGTVITVTGTGFSAKEFVSILFDTNISGTGYVTVARAQALQLPRTTTVGFTARFAVPPCSGATATLKPSEAHPARWPTRHCNSCHRP